MTEENPVVEVAKEQRQKETTDDILTLSTGVRVRVRQVNQTLIGDAQSRLEYPDPPEHYVERKGRWEPNYDNPQWKAKCAEIDVRRGLATLDAYCMFGIELVDGIPEDKTWVKQLRLLGYEFDAEDEVEAEFYYKKYIALLDSDDFDAAIKGSVTSGGIADKEASFRGDEERPGHPRRKRAKAG